MQLRAVARVLMDESRDLLAECGRLRPATSRERGIPQNLGLDVLRYSVPLLDNACDQAANDHFVLLVLKRNYFDRF